MTALTIGLGRELVERLGWCLVHSVWQLAAVGLVAAIVLRGLRRRSAQARYLAACAAMAAMAMLPALTFATIRISGDAASKAGTTASASVTDFRSRASEPSRAPEDRRHSPAEEPSVVAHADSPARFPKTWDETFRPWLPGLVVIWGLVVSGLSLRLVGGWFCIQWLVRHRTRPAPERWIAILERLERRMGMRGAVRLLESARAPVPMVVGWLRPAILLPVTALTGLPSDQLEAILAHELAHIRRYDYLVNLIQSVVETLLFYHPAAWWVSGRIRVEREHCCDDSAVAACGDRVLYARALAALEGQRGGGWRLAPSARDGSLLARVRRLLGVSAPAERPAGGLAGTLAMAVVVTLGLALFLAPPPSQARAGSEVLEAINGSVVTAAGQPVAGADVWLVVHSSIENQGVILSKARTDAEGRFRLILREERLKLRHLGWRAIWAYRPGMQLATIVGRDDTSRLGFDPGRTVKLTLGEAATASFRVLDPAEKPVAGAELALNGLDEGFTSLPGELADALAARTDRDGRATLNGAPLERVRGIRVKTDSLGTQDFYAHLGFKPDAPLRLRAAVPVEGRVTADDPGAVRGLTLSFTTYPGEARDLTKLIPGGRALVVTDDQGRFRIDALATGQIDFWADTSDESMYRAPRLDNREVRAGERAEIVIPLKKLIHVRGLVQEKGAHKPIPGVGLSFGSRELRQNLPTVKTDADGRYQALALPGPKGHCYVSEAQGYLKPLQASEMTIGPADGQTLPPIELERGVTLSGVVVDEAGQPVAGAKVEGKWSQLGQPFKAANGAKRWLSANLSATATANDRGQFILDAIHPRANVMLEASLGNARTDRPQPAAAGTNSPVKLIISGANTVALLGHVVDSAGQPVAGAVVQIHTRPLKDDGHPDPNPIRFEEGEIRTGRDGRFRAPRELKRGYGYRAEIRSDDPSLMPDHTPWLAIKADTRPFFPKLVLRRLRTVHGRVLDSTGQPVAGTSVRQAGDGPARTETLTGDDGRFALPGVLAEPAFVFAAKPGYRFQGQAIGADDSTVDVTLARIDEPLPSPRATLPPPLTRTEELALLHRLLDESTERAVKEGNDRVLIDRLHLLVEFDRPRVMELLNDPRLQPPQFDGLRGEVANRLVRENYDDARELIEAIRDTDLRSYVDAEASAALPDTERPHKLQLLNEALIAARAIPDPAWRVIRLADIGERFLDTNQPELAAKVLREGQTIAAKLPTTGTNAWARGKLAEELAPIDIPAALSLLKGTEQEREYGRYLGRIAHELAGRNPAEAERILMMSPDEWPNFRDNYTQRVCHRMAGVDLERARKLAAGMKNYRNQARALGAMALMIVKTQQGPLAASRLFDEAFAVLDEAVASDHDDWDGLGMACTAAAGLLPLIEQVDARRIPEFLWRTLALRPPIPGPRGRDGISDLAAARVAAMAARYDRAIARQVFHSFADRALAERIGLEDWGSMFRGDSIFESAAVVDPAWGADTTASRPGPKDSARLSFARILALQGDDRWRAVEEYLLHLWRIDSEDH